MVTLSVHCHGAGKGAGNAYRNDLFWCGNALSYQTPGYGEQGIPPVGRVLLGAASRALVARAEAARRAAAPGAAEQLADLCLAAAGGTA